MLLNQGENSKFQSKDFQNVRATFQLSLKRKFQGDCLLLSCFTTETAYLQIH